VTITCLRRLTPGGEFLDKKFDASGPTVAAM
jgi:hypothetical protein